MANPTTNYGWPMPTSTDLVTDLPADFALFGQPVDTSLKALNPETTLGDIAYRSSTSNTNTRLGIGTNGQVLAVASGVPAWTTTADVTPLTTKGDIFTFSTVDARLAVGTNGQVLTADSSEATGLKYATPAAGGKVLQVVYASTTSTVTISSTTFTDTGLTATITPTLNTSKIFVIYNQQLLFQQANSNPTAGSQVQLMRGSTAIFGNGDTSGTGSHQVDAKPGDSGVVKWQCFVPGAFLDSPATTSATTYKTQAKESSTANSAALLSQGNGAQSNITLLEIGA